MAENETPEREGYVFLGKVAVDSARLMICDPSYVLLGEDGSPDYAVTAEAAYAATDDVRAAPLINELGKEDVGLVFRSGYGDDVYPIFGKYDQNGRIVEVLVDMHMSPVQKKLFGVQGA